MFGRKDEVDPVQHLIGTAAGWGGNPAHAALYAGAEPKQNDGKTVYRLTVKDVPVDGFWSVSVYNKDGYFQKNARNAYTVNNVTAKPNADGSVTIQFGGDEGAPNCMPIMPGWNYVRPDVPPAEGNPRRHLEVPRGPAGEVITTQFGERSLYADGPIDIATCMWYTGIDPMTGKPVRVARHLRDRKLQRALMQFFKPDNWFEVREALVEAGRPDLIGTGCDALIPPNPPREAMEARRRKANRAAQGDDDNDHYHTVANPANGEKPGERGGRGTEADGLSAGPKVTDPTAWEEARRRLSPSTLTDHSGIALCRSQPLHDLGVAVVEEGGFARCPAWRSPPCPRR